MNINEKIRMMRELNQWSQEDMAERMNMSVNGYAKIERGETKLKLDKLTQIAQIFNVDIVELMQPGENGILIFMNDNSATGHNGYNNTYYNGNEAAGHEIDKLKLMLAHKDEIISQKNSELEILKEMVTLLKQQKP